MLTEIDLWNTMYHCGQEEAECAERGMQRMHEHRDSLACDDMVDVRPDCDQGEGGQGSGRTCTHFPLLNGTI